MAAGGAAAGGDGALVAGLPPAPVPLKKRSPPPPSSSAPRPPRPLRAPATAAPAPPPTRPFPAPAPAPLPSQHQPCPNPAPAPAPTSAPAPAPVVPSSLPGALLPPGAAFNDAPTPHREAPAGPSASEGPDGREGRPLYCWRYLQGKACEAPGCERLHERLDRARYCFKFLAEGACPRGPACALSHEPPRPAAPAGPGLLGSAPPRPRPRPRPCTAARWRSIVSSVAAASASAPADPFPAPAPHPSPGPGPGPDSWGHQQPPRAAFGQGSGGKWERQGAGRSARSCHFFARGIDPSLIEKHFPPPIKLTVVHDRDALEPDAPARRQLEKLKRDARVTTVSPVKGKIMHAKLMLIEGHERLRVVITSANFGSLDWYKLSQNVYMQDFEKRTDKSESDVEEFGVYLVKFLEELGAKWDFGKWLEIHATFDFSPAKARPALSTARRCLLSLIPSGAGGQVKLVATVPGKHSENDLHKWGQLRLAEVMAGTLGEDTLYYQSPCAGQLTPEFCAQFCLSAAGGPGTHRDAEGENRAASCERPAAASAAALELRVVLTASSVANVSRYGPEDRGYVGQSRKLYEKATFPKAAVFQAEAVRPSRARVLMHSKVLARGGALLYEGSANFSKAAWGELRKDRTELDASACNYELGVAFPGGLEPALSSEVLPFKIPPRPYGPRDSPWFDVHSRRAEDPEL
eukprot:tig00000863_g4996.t1